MLGAILPRYENFASEIIASIQWEVQYNFALMQQLSASVTAAASMTGQSFPNLTQPYFEITGGYADGLGGIMSAAFAPLVKAEEREQWEEYSVLNQGWIAESKVLKQDHPGHRDPLLGTNQDHEHVRRLQSATVPPTGISNQIYRWENGTKVPELSYDGQIFAPIWQVSPPSPTAVNANLFSDKRFTDLYEAMVATKQSVQSATTEIGDMFDFLFDPEEKDLKANAHSFLMEPVYSSFEESPKLVGVLIAVTAYSNLLDRLLPEKPMVLCVL